MEVLKMKDANPEAQIDSTGIPPPKRKRGRPRKTHHLYPGGKTLGPQQLDGKKKTRRKKLDSSLSSFSDNAFVGQPVHGMLDGSFDAGYLLTVRVGETDTVLRGVVFEPGLLVPISRANDIAPSVKMTRRDDHFIPPSELPPYVQNVSSVAMPSTPAPLLSASAPVMNAQGLTSVSMPDYPMPPAEAGSEQTRVVSLEPNGSPPKSGKVNEDPDSKPAESVSQSQQHISSPVKTVPLLQQPIYPSAIFVSQTQQPMPVSVEQASQQQPIPTRESVSHSRQPNPSCAEPLSQPQQAITHPPEPLGMKINAKQNVQDA